MTDYRPINCDFHSILESHAVKKTQLLIKFKNDNDEVTSTTSVINDMYTREGEEFAVLDGNLVLRLDQIISVSDNS